MTTTISAINEGRCEEYGGALELIREGGSIELRLTQSGAMIRLTGPEAAQLGELLTQRGIDETVDFGESLLVLGLLATMEAAS